METYLGETPAYWLELQKQVKSLKYETLIREIATLRAKVSFYESRLQEMNNFKDQIK